MPWGSSRDHIAKYFLSPFLLHSSSTRQHVPGGLEMTMTGGRGWSEKSGFKKQKCFLWLNLKVINLKLIRKMFLPLRCTALLNTYAFLFIRVKDMQALSIRTLLGWQVGVEWMRSCLSAPSHFVSYMLYLYTEWMKVSLEMAKKRTIKYIVGNLYWAGDKTPQLGDLLRKTGKGGKEK